MRFVRTHGRNDFPQMFRFEGSLTRLRLTQTILSHSVAHRNNMERFYLLRAAPVPVRMHQVHQVEVQDAEVAARGTLKTQKSTKNPLYVAMQCYAMLCNAMQCYAMLCNVMALHMISCSQKRFIV